MVKPLLLLLTLALASAADNSTGLIGRWKSVDVSKAGVSSVFLFGKDQVIDSYSAVFIESKYRLFGTDTILLRAGDGPEQKWELEWDNDGRARIEDEAIGKVIPLSRAGKRSDASNPLVGEWDATYDWNGKTYPARALFFANNTNLWIVNLHVTTGRYSLKDGTMRLEIEGRPPVEGNFALTGDRLTIPNPRGGQSAFERTDFESLSKVKSH